jgi:hypothetical protein
MVTAMNGQLFRMIRALAILYHAHSPTIIRFFQQNPMYAAVVVAAIARAFGIIPMRGRDRQEGA